MPDDVEEYVIEGERWPEALLSDSDTLKALGRLNSRLRTNLGQELSVTAKDGRSKVAYGLAGFVRLGTKKVYVIPKCFSSTAADVERRRAWQEGIPRFLKFCSSLSGRSIYVSGPGIFSASNTLLSWWATYYSNVLWRALHSFPYLRYESKVTTLPYVRGQFSWPGQIQEWGRGGHRIVCAFRSYQVDNALNRLLSWAASYFIGVAQSADVRTRLSDCIGLLEGVEHIRPERIAVDMIRLPASMAVYREPLGVARALYFSLYPTLRPGDLPAAGFLIDMASAFEAFVDRLVFHAAREAAKRGEHWQFQSQTQQRLAVALARSSSHTDYYTRPDNLLKRVLAQDSFTNCVVIDAKYKGTSAAPLKYRRPVREDLYQILASCIAHRCLRGIIVSPTTIAGEVGSTVQWEIDVPFSKAGSSKVRISWTKVDMAGLRSAAGTRAIVHQIYDLARQELDNV